MKHFLFLFFIVSIFTFATKTAANSAPESASDNFSPDVWIKLGYTNAEFSSFEIEGERLSSSSVLSAAIEYQFTPQWSASLLVTGATDCFIFCDEGTVNADGQFVDVDYDVGLFQTTAVYTVPINDDIAWRFNFGVVLADESITIETCDDQTFGFFGQYCSEDDVISLEQESHLKLAPIAGIGIDYRFAKNWNLGLSFDYSSLREGFSQTNFNIGYRF